MNEKQKKKLSKLLAKWGVGEEELKDFLMDLDNEPDEEDEEEVVEDKVEEEEVEEVADEEPKGEEAEEKTETEEVEVDGDEKKVEETEKVEPDGEVDEKVEVENEENKELEVKNEEYEAKVVELQDALNGLENRIASLEKGLMNAGILTNTEVKQVGVGADNEAKGEIVDGSREDLLARLNGRR